MPNQQTTFPVSKSVAFPDLYEHFLVPPLFAPWANQLLDRISVRADGMLVDVACGTGILGRLARQRVPGALRVVGVDRNPAMLAVARGVEPAIDWREGDATALPIGADEHADVVCCHQGLQFFPDKPAAVAEMRRVLAPGGAVGIGVWRKLEENDVFDELGQIAERYVGPIADARHSFGDDQALRRLLSDAGFLEVQVEPVSLTLRFTTEPEVLARLNAAAVVGMSSRGKAMSEDDKATTVSTIVDASLEALARHVADGVLTMQTSANLATGRA